MEEASSQKLGSREEEKPWTCDTFGPDWRVPNREAPSVTDWVTAPRTEWEDPFRARPSVRMGYGISQVGLALLTVLACGTFFIQYSIFQSIHHAPHGTVLSEDASENALVAGRSSDLYAAAGVLEFDHQIDLDTADAAVVPSNGNFYISVKNYIARTNPAQHVEQTHKQTATEPTAYKVVAELGHRYGVKYIIDIGCGTAKYLAQLRHEFRIIGIDYGINLEKAKKAYPGLTFLDVDLDKGKGCTLSLPEDVLFQSLVISAEVIEHLVDPSYCYLRVLRHVSAYAAAVVVTSPDRERLATSFHWQHRLSGPPMNKHHVREWTIDEMSHMFRDIDMHVVLSAWVCGKNKRCPAGYSLNKNPFVSQLHVLGNSNVRKVWEDWSVPVTTKLTTFVFIQPKTRPSLARGVVDHLIQQGSQVVLIQRKCNVTLPPNPAILASYYIEKIGESLLHIKSVMSSDAYNFKYGDWFMVQDAHEYVTIPAIYKLGNYTLRRFLQQVAFEPYGFNAVATTILSMNASKLIKANDHLPFKIHTMGSWDSADGSTLYPRRDTVRDKVRIWRKTYRTPKLFTSGVNRTGTVITDVHFLGRRVYPFHLQSMRYAPSTKSPHPQLSVELSQMYGLEIGIGYTPAIRKAVFQRHLSY